MLIQFDAVNSFMLGVERLKEELAPYMERYSNYGVREPLMEYLTLKEKLLKFRFTAVFITALATVPYVQSCLKLYHVVIRWVSSCDNTGATTGIDQGGALFFAFLGGVIALVISVFVWKSLKHHHDDLLEAWLGREWTSKNFYADLRSLMFMAGIPGYDLNGLVGNGREVSEVKMPSHVQSSCLEILIKAAMNILAKEPTVARAHFEDADKVKLKEQIAVAMRFKILDGRLSEKFVYEQAAAQLKIEKAAAQA